MFIKTPHHILENRIGHFLAKVFMSITEMKSWTTRRFMVFRTQLLPVPWRSRGDSKMKVHEVDWRRAMMLRLPKINYQMGVRLLAIPLQRMFILESQGNCQSFYL